MNNLLSNCGLVDARISASEKDLPVLQTYMSDMLHLVLGYLLKNSYCDSEISQRGQNIYDFAMETYLQFEKILSVFSV